MTNAKDVWLALVIAAVLAGCFIHGARREDKEVTGTCAGACERYVQCKGTEAVRDKCNAECPEVFGDRQSIMAFESLDCEYVLGFVEGERPTRGHPTTTARAPAATR